MNNFNTHTHTHTHTLTHNTHTCALQLLLQELLRINNPEAFKKREDAEIERRREADRCARVIYLSLSFSLFFSHSAYV